MKSTILLFVALIYFQSNIAFSSEVAWSLKQKVSFSDFIAVCTIKSIKLGEIKKHKNYGYSKTQEVELVVDIDDFIKGKSERSIKITCYASSYAGVWCSAGFSSKSLEKGQQYIVYLKNIINKYYLSIHSNQCLEKIDTQKNTVTDIGQTAKQVPLKEKLQELRKLAKESQKTVKTSKLTPIVEPIKKQR